MSAAEHLQEAIDVGCTRDDHDHVADHRAEVLAEAAAMADEIAAAALDHGALTDTETAAHITVMRAARHLRELAGEPDPTDPPEYRYCGAILVGRTEWPRTCHRRIGHDGPCGPQTDAEGGEPSC